MHAIICHLYADDQQIYLFFKPSQPGSHKECLAWLKSCIADIRKWMTTDMLKLNNDKLKFILFRMHKQLKKIQTKQIAIGSTLVAPVDYVRNLGFFMDKLLKNHYHINKITSGTFLQIRNIRTIWSRLHLGSAKALTQALVLSKLDYCNGLLLGSAEYQLEKLQRIQHMACQVVTGLRKHDHISASMQTVILWT